MEADALRDWLLDRLEDRALWFGPAPALRSVAQLADALRTDADFVSVAGLYARDADLADVVAALVRDQHVPFVAALRYTESGMRIRAQWEEHLGSAAPRGRRGEGRRHPGPAEIQAGRLP